MKKNPIVVFTGLAVAAVAGVAGLTRDRWMDTAPTTVAAVEASKVAEAPAAEAQPAAPAAPAAEPAQQQAAAPAAEAPAVAEQPAADTSQQAAAPATETPATDAPATEAAPAVAADAVPTFDTVRVEKTGEAVIAGQAEAGSQVAVKLDGETIGTATANADGSFVVVPEQPLPAGSGALTIEAKGANDAAATASEQSVAVIVPEQSKGEALVAVVSPDAPTKVLQAPEPPPVAAATPEAATAEPVAEQPAAPAAAQKQVSLDAVDYDPSGNIVFSGRGQPGTGARIYVDNAHTGDAPVSAEGKWQFSGTTKVSPGVHALRIDGVDGAGKVINRIEVPFFREDTTKVAAETPKTDAEQPVAQATTQPEPPKDGRIVIQPGNNLWRISKVIYGEGKKYTLLYQANKDQIRNADLIYPGQVFMTPDVAPPETIDPDQREPLAPVAETSSAQ